MPMARESSAQKNLKRQYRFKVCCGALPASLLCRSLSGLVGGVLPYRETGADIYPGAMAQDIEQKNDKSTRTHAE